jgi:histidine ammonia-lyase
MSVTVTGRDLVLEDIVAVARGSVGVSIDGSAIERMIAARAVVERALARGAQIYGLTTGVGAGKTQRVEPGEAAAVQWSLVRSHLVGQGPAFAPEVVRAAALILANGFAAGWSGVRPELATRLVDALNTDRLPEAHRLGSVGQADLAALAELAVGVFEGLDLAPGEGLALLSSNAFATGLAALAVTDVGVLLDALDAAGAMSLEGFGGDLGMLHPAIGDARPFPGVRTSLERLRDHLESSDLWNADTSRNLQDPLTFRSLPQVNGAARDAHSWAAAQLATELNASQNNPLVLVDEDLVISVANFEAQPLATAMDVIRIGLAPAVLASGERAVKLLDTSWSGLPRGLVEGARDGLAFLGIATQSLAAEAALLAGPVSFALASTAHAEGIEDRTAMASLAARRVDEMADLARRVVAIELVVAAQAINIQGQRSIGRGVARSVGSVRRLVPAATAAQPDPPGLEPLIDLIRSGLPSVSFDSASRDS